MTLSNPAHHTMEYLEISPDDFELHWTSLDYERNFNEAREVYVAGRRDNIKSGVLPISSLFTSGRLLLWEFASGLLYLREYWLHGNVCDSAVILNLGEYGVVAEKFFSLVPDHEGSSSGANDSLQAECRFLLRDSTVLSFRLESKSRETSILLPFIEYLKGKIVDFADSYVGMPEHRRLKISCVPDANSIIGASWISDNELLVALMGGNTMKIECTGTVLTETVLSDTTRLGTFIKGITRSLTQHEQLDTLAVCGNEVINISLDSSGILRMWSNVDNPCVFRKNLFEIIFEHMSMENYSGMKLLAARMSIMRRENSFLLGIGAKGPGASTPVNDWKMTVLEFTVDGVDIELRSHSPLNSDEFLKTNDCKITCVDFNFNEIDSLLIVNWEVASNDTDFTAYTQVLSVYPVNSSNLGSEISPVVVKVPSSDVNRILTISDREIESNNTNDSSYMSITQLESKMLKRIFYPGRFPVSIIRSTLKNDIPYELQSLLAANSYKFNESLPDRVLFMCREWSGIMFQEKYDGENRDIDDKLKFDCSRKVFLIFLELCDRRMKKENILSKQSISSSCSSPEGLPFTCIAVRNLNLTYILPMPQLVDSVEQTPTNQFFKIVEKFLNDEDLLQRSVSQILEACISNFYAESDSDFGNANELSLSTMTDGLELSLRQSEHFVAVASDLQNVMMENCCNCISVMEAIELRLNALDTPCSIEDSGLTKANDTSLFTGECGASLMSKVAWLTVNDRFERLKVLVVSGLFIAFHLSDSFNSSVHANFVDVYLPRAIAQLTYTSFLKNLGTINIAVCPGNDMFVSQNQKMTHRFLRWDTSKLHFSSMSLSRYAGLWNEIWRNLASRVTCVWATEQEILNLSQTRYFWYRISTLISRMLRPTHVSDLILSLWHLDHPSRCLQAQSIIQMYPRRRGTDLHGVFRSEKKLQILGCCQRSNAALSSLVYGLKMNSVSSSSSSGFYETMTIKLLDRATPGLSIVFVERDMKVFEEVNVSSPMSSPMVSDLVYEWIKSFADDPAFDDVLTIGNFLYNASLSPEMSFVIQFLMNQFATDGRRSFQCIDYLIDECSDLLAVFHNIEYLLACLRQVDRFLDSNISFDVNRSVSIKLWWKYIKEVDRLSILLMKIFPSIQAMSNDAFRFWIASRKRDALNELVKHCLTLRDLDGAYQGISEMMSLENFAEDPEEQWKYSIRNMAVCACDSGRLEWLCTLPNKAFKDTSVSESIVSELEKVAMQSDVTRGLQEPSSVASYYESLFAFFIQKKDYRRLATEAVSFKNRLMLDVDGIYSLPLAKDALSLAIHGLCTLDSEHAYVINTRGEMFTTIEDIKNDLIELMCQHSVLSKGHNEYVTKDLISMMETLLNNSEYSEAISLINSSEESFGLKSSLIKRVVESLADASISKSCNNYQGMNNKKMDFSSNFGNISSSLDHSIYSESVWNHAHDLLLILKEKDLQMFDSFMSKLIAAAGRVPESISFLYATSIDKGLRSIVETLISNGDLIEACNFAEIILSSQSQEKMMKSCKYTVPYNTLDRLLKACSIVCQQGETTVTKFKRHKIDLCALKASIKRLEGSIENYFVVLHGVDELSAY